MSNLIKECETNNWIRHPYKSDTTIRVGGLVWKNLLRYRIKNQTKKINPFRVHDTVDTATSFGTPSSINSSTNHYVFWNFI